MMALHVASDTPDLQHKVAIWHNINNDNNDNDSYYYYY